MGRGRQQEAPIVSSGPTGQLDTMCFFKNKTKQNLLWWVPRTTIFYLNQLCVCGRGAGLWLECFVKGWESNSKALWKLNSTLPLSYIPSETLFLFLFYIYLVSVCMYMYNVTWHMCENQRAADRSWGLFPPCDQTQVIGLDTKPLLPTDLSH